VHVRARQGPQAPIGGKLAVLTVKLFRLVAPGEGPRESPLITSGSRAGIGQPSPGPGLVARAHSYVPNRPPLD